MKTVKRNRKGEIIVDIEAVGIRSAPVFILLRETVPNFSVEYNDLAAEIWKCGIAIAMDGNAVIAELQDEIQVLQNQIVDRAEPK